MKYANVVQMWCKFKSEQSVEVVWYEVCWFNILSSSGNVSLAYYRCIIISSNIGTEPPLFSISLIVWTMSPSNSYLKGSEPLYNMLWLVIIYWGLILTVDFPCLGFPCKSNVLVLCDVMHVLITSFHFYKLDEILWIHV